MNAVRKQGSAKHGRDTLARDLARVLALDRAALVEQWRQLYGNEPPAKVGSGLLMRAIAYRVQKNALGGLKPATQRYLANVVTQASGKQQKSRNGLQSDDWQLCSEKSSSTKIAAPPIAIKPGTRLLREWYGVTHEVVVLEEGVRYREKQYRSLSEVARIITGTKWPGPLFFGLKSAERKRVA